MLNVDMFATVSSEIEFEAHDADIHITGSLHGDILEMLIWTCE
jgi:hypothetical protein